jgi:hypothetical protein
MAKKKQGSAQPDLNDPAQVMAILRNASHQLKLGDARVAEAEKRAVEAEQQLARATEERQATDDRNAPEIEAAERRAAQAEMAAQTAEQRALEAEERLARAAEDRKATEDYGAPDFDAERRASEAELAAQAAEEALRAVQERAERAEERAEGIERTLAASRQRFRLALGSVASLALLGVVSSGYLALQKPVPPPAPALPRVAEVQPPKPSPPSAPPASVLERLGPPRTVKTVRLSPGYDAPPETHAAAPAPEATPNQGPTEQAGPQPLTSLANAGQLRAPAPKPKRDAAPPR